jgi:peptidoglycan/LPS O-acetylase OafA/YrhL
MTSGWHYAMTSVEFIRIPLFTALSGYLYAGRRVTRAAFGRFWSKKLRRLGVPLVCVTIALWLLQTCLYADPTPLPRAMLFSFGHLWYIQALILLFAAIAICDGFFRPGPVALALAGLVAIMISQSGWSMTTFFSLAGAFYLAPYFLFGILLREHPAWLRDRSTGALALGIVVIVLACQQLGLNGLMHKTTVLQMPAALAGMAGVIFLLQRFPRITLLAAIGGYSYTIYLWHVVAGAATRLVLINAGIDSIPILFGLIFITAVIAPILLYHVARTVPLLSVAATGETWLRPNAAIMSIALAESGGRPWSGTSGSAPAPEASTPLRRSR